MSRKHNNFHGPEAVRLEPWFHGMITREEAERLLYPFNNGKYLVRESTHYHGDFTLCVCADSRVEHYRVIKDAKGLTVDEEEFFPTLHALIEHYTEDADGLASALMSPVLDPSSFKKAGWCIDRAQIKLGRNLGKGNFGEVRIGEFNGKAVAIKVTKDEAIQTQNLLAEASIMTQLKHPNLVGLIGISPGNEIWIVLEYMSKGNLLDYLRSRGRTVIRQLDQLNFCVDIASGMSFLEDHRFVHRDLAARNILVSEEDIAKVADFGMSQHIREQVEKSKIPVKWTAPEAVRDRRYSTKSDVWSFGILMWELYSFGRVPYPRVPADNVITFVEEGNRMQAPDDCPENVYKVMFNCWHRDPDKRPMFSRIQQKLQDLRHELVDEQRRMETTS